MATLYLPPKVARELLDTRQQFAQCLRNATTVDAVCAEWGPELRRLDPLMEMRKAPEYTVIGMPLVPGFYHLIRWNETTAPSVTPVRHADGSFRVPDSALLDKLRFLDLQSAQVVAAHRVMQERERLTAERDKLRTREGRQGNILERFVATQRTQVSMNPDVPWAQNAAGFKRIRGERVHTPKGGAVLLEPPAKAA